MVQVSIDESRINLRALKELPIRVKASTTDSSTEFAMTDVPGVRLSFDASPLTAVSGVLGEDRKNILVARTAYPFKPGALTAEVTLPGLASAVSSGNNRLFWEPMLGSAETVLPGAAGMTNPNRTGTVKGRVAVQVASPVAKAGQLLITEEIEFATRTWRWLDLYEQDGSGKMGYASSAEWQQTAMSLFEGPNAQFALIPGAVVFYDFYMGTMRNDLALLPLKAASSQRGLSQVEPKVPTDATALAACSEETTILLARTGEVHALRMDPNPAQKAVTHLTTIPLTGEPVIAARAAKGLAPTQSSDEYFGVVWEKGSGKGLLLKLTKSAGVATGVEQVPLPGEVNAAGLGAAALADLDSDGLQDLIVAAKNGELLWSPQRPDKSFPALASLKVSAPGATSISVGDLNGDQLPDLAVATADKNVLIFRNKP